MNRGRERGWDKIEGGRWGGREGERDNESEDEVAKSSNQKFSES
jgi:hypothetical protein